MNWYENLPESCHPKDAMEPSGEQFYRILSSENPSNGDFLSYRAQQPGKRFSVSECQAMAISVFTDIESCRTVAKFPKFKNKDLFIGKFALDKLDGLVAHTPNKNSMTHYSWWRSKEFDINKVSIVNE